MTQYLIYLCFLFILVQSHSKRLYPLAKNSPILVNVPENTPIQFIPVSGVLTPGSTTLIKPLYPSSSSTSQQLTNMQFEVKNLWNGEECSEKPVKFNLKKCDNGINITIEAPFYDDPAPPALPPAGDQALHGLWNYEVVEIFFLASKNEDMYLELEFGPHGHHLGLLLHGERNTLTHSFPIQYKAEINKENESWKGEAFIPNEYFPPNVDKYNAYAIHGPEDKRVYKALFSSDGENPDFHDLKSFKPLELAIDQNSISKFWQDAMEVSQNVDLFNNLLHKHYSEEEIAQVLG